MALATGVTITASLSPVVRDIYERSYKYMAHTGVLKKLVTQVGKGGKGDQVTVPTWDPTSRSGTAGSEGTDFTAFTSYLNSSATFVATEWIEGTRLTYNDYEDASESVRQEHGRMHGMVHAKKLEQKIATVFGDFSSNTITATSTSGLTYAKLQAAKVAIKDQSQMFDGPFSLVVNDPVYYYLQKNLTQNSNFGPLGTLGDKLLDRYYGGSVGNDIQVFYSNLGINPGTATTTECALFAKEAIGLFMPRDFKMEEERNISLRGYELVSTHRAGAKTYIEPAGCTIKAYGVAPS